MQLIVRSIDFDERLAQSKRTAILQKIARKSVKVFKQEITKRHLINTRNLIDSVGATVGENDVTVEIGADYAGILNDGVRRHKMRYLVDKGPIPVITSSGRKIFRVATKKNINRSGLWVHPGFKRGKHFFDDGVDKIQNICRKIILDEGLI